jgi:DNA-binding LytR/AlgR family response regulator
MEAAKKILIVEDEVIISESLFQLLTLLDYNPLDPVETPAQGIEAIKTDHPDLAILDIQLGKAGSGLEVADYILQQKLDIPFIILTAYSDAETIAKVKKYKPAAYLVKPFQRESLFAAIEMAMPEEKNETEAAEYQQNNTELFLKIGTKHEKIDLKDIIYLQASGQYTEMYFENGKKRLQRIALSSFVQAYPEINWRRIHKSYAVNPGYVESLSASEIRVKGAKLPIGRFFQPETERFFFNKKEK